MSEKFDKYDKNLNSADDALMDYLSSMFADGEAPAGNNPDQIELSFDSEHRIHSGLESGADEKPHRSSKVTPIRPDISAHHTHNSADESPRMPVQKVNQPDKQAESKVVDQQLLEREKRAKLQKLLAQPAIQSPPIQSTPKVSTDEPAKSEIIDKQSVTVESSPPEGSAAKVSDTPQEHREAQGKVTEKVKENVKENEPTVSSELKNEAQTEAQTESELSWAANGKPKWAQNRFDALLFQVSGLTLAVPLIALGHISPIDKKLTKLMGQSEWFMGILPTPQGDIKTINTALFVMPEKYNESFVDNAKYVITIDGMRWGLAVDSVNQPVTLSPDDVKWRSDRTKRAWLAGTVKDKMCALIDIPQMAHQIKGMERSV